MSIFKELSTSLKATLYERAMSPLSGSFVGAWIIFNWKAIAVFVWGQGDMSSKILFIENHYVDIWANLYYPAIWAAIFVFVYPIAALVPYALWEKVSGWKLQIKQRFENTVALPVPQSIALRKELRDKEREFLLSMESKDAKISELQSLNEATSNELAKLKEAISSKGDAESQLVRMTERLTQTELALNQVKQDSDLKEREARTQTDHFRQRISDLEKEKAERKPAKSIDEAVWWEEYRELVGSDSDAKQKIKAITKMVVNTDSHYDEDDLTWGVAKGLITGSGRDIALTPKGQFFAGKAF